MGGLSPLYLLERDERGEERRKEREKRRRGG
jgi:hypothetical protein